VSWRVGHGVIGVIDGHDDATARWCGVQGSSRCCGC
jgi:hypothetical protein